MRLGITFSDTEDYQNFMSTFGFENTAGFKSKQHLSRTFNGEVPEDMLLEVIETSKTVYGIETIILHT